MSTAASLATHLTAFVFLFPVGIKRLITSFSLYLTNPSLYKSKPWYFSGQSKFENLDLYILSIALPIASFSEFFLFITFSGHPTYKFAFFHQSLALFLFWVLLIIVILKEHLGILDNIDEGFVFVFAAVVFLIEYGVIGKGIELTGVGGAVYGLLGSLTFVCAACCLYLSVKPHAFFAEFVLSCGLVFKGCWVLQAGLSLGSDAFGLKGCGKLSFLQRQENADVKCDLEEDGLRALALINLLFVLHAIGVFILSFLSMGFVSFKRFAGHGDVSGPLLAQLESDRTMMHSIPEFELE